MSTASLLPPPGDLDRYVQHLPDAAERLLAAAEREQAHRHQLENRLLAIDADTVPLSFESHRRTCRIALVVGLAHLAVMVVAVLEGYATAGTAGAALGMAAVAWATRPPARPHIPRQHRESRRSGRRAARSLMSV